MLWAQWCHWFWTHVHYCFIIFASVISGMLFLFQEAHWTLLWRRECSDIFTPSPALFLSFFGKHLLCGALYNQCSSKRVCLADSRLKMSYPLQVDAFISLWSVILINGVKSLSFREKNQTNKKARNGPNYFWYLSCIKACQHHTNNICSTLKPLILWEERCFYLVT